MAGVLLLTCVTITAGVVMNRRGVMIAGACMPWIVSVGYLAWHALERLSLIARGIRPAPPVTGVQIHIKVEPESREPKPSESRLS